MRFDVERMCIRVRPVGRPIGSPFEGVASVDWFETTPTVVSLANPERPIVSPSSNFEEENGNSRWSIINDDPDSSFPPSFPHDFFNFLSTRIDLFDPESSSLPSLFSSFSFSWLSFGMFEKKGGDSRSQVDESTVETKD